MFSVTNIVADVLIQYAIGHVLFIDKTSGASEMSETPVGTARAEDPLGKRLLLIRVS